MIASVIGNLQTSSTISDSYGKVQGNKPNSGFQQLLALVNGLQTELQSMEGFPNPSANNLGNLVTTISTAVPTLTGDAQTVLEQKSTLDAALEQAGISSDEIFTAIKQVIRSLLENSEESVEQKTAESSEATGIYQLLDGTDPKVLSEDVFITFIQFISQVHDNDFSPALEQKDWNNIVKTASYINQLIKTQNQAITLTDEQQAIVKDFIESLQSNSQNTGVLQKAYASIKHTDASEKLPVFFSKPVYISGQMAGIGERNLAEKGQQTANNTRMDVPLSGSQQTGEFMNLEKIDGRYFAAARSNMLGSELVNQQETTKNLAAEISSFMITGEEGQDSEIPLQQAHKELSAGNGQATPIMNNILLHQPNTSAFETLQLMDEGNAPVSFERFTKEFESLLAKSKFMDNGQIQKLTIQLKPEHLGSLKIELIQQQNQLIAKIISSTSSAKELLESQVQSLKQAFINQNINVSRIEVENLQREEFSGNDRNEHGNQDEKQQDEQKKENRQNQEWLYSSFQEELLNFEI